MAYQPKKRKGKKKKASRQATRTRLGTLLRTPGRTGSHGDATEARRGPLPPPARRSPGSWESEPADSPARRGRSGRGGVGLGAPRPPAPWPAVPSPGLRPRTPRPGGPATPSLGHTSDPGEQGLGGQLERLEQSPGAGRPQSPGPTRPAGAAGSPGDRPRRRHPARPPRERPRTARSPSMCQKRMFAAARPTSPLRWPGQARPATRFGSPPQPRAPLRAPRRPAPPRHVRGRLGVRGHSVTHGGGARSMRASARAAGAGLRRGWRQVGGGRRAGPGALTSGWRRPLRRRPQSSRLPQNS